MQYQFTKTWKGEGREEGKMESLTPAKTGLCVCVLSIVQCEWRFISSWSEGVQFWELLQTESA